ncbi:class I lanthipeptide [Archangium gephyra]|uniref:class I lanthipeptide n=1 Tax=Archangium gephyra TaxID=48 RepID=UPI003B7FE73D
MDEKKEKKLRLNKETIRNLSDESLEQVAGGKKKGQTGLICVSQVKFTACVGCSIIC